MRRLGVGSWWAWDFRFPQPPEPAIVSNEFGGDRIKRARDGWVSVHDPGGRNEPEFPTAMGRGEFMARRRRVRRA